MAKLLVKDILSTESGLIVHQVNCQKVAGAGIALAIRQKYPNWYNHYLTIDPILGKVDLFEAEDNIWIVSFYAQNRYGRTERHTDYDAFDRCLETLAGIISAGYCPNPTYFSEGIGCKLAGGDWNIVLPKIITAIPDAFIVRPIKFPYENFRPITNKYINL